MNLIMNIKVVFIGILLLGLIFISLGTLISSIVKSDKGAIPISIGIFFVSYFLGIIGKLKDSFNWLKYFSPFDYYDPSEILKDGFEVKFIIIGICVIIISIISSYFIYGKKDMNIVKVFLINWVNFLLLYYEYDKYNLWFRV